ncbi:hypothetical protein K431DRAFT_98824 [Polychaeton citri CBS 116435]|uniref:Uncharacterized protein n=1 Tax=Polychaeton citri CBS 116435 TaxID=1314669 RepID=A0A9P4QDE4_9PEZI|nr:hypothetical protein K431DRAFT_98824 [Polychaeton citri CBS 116435]
MFVDVKDVPAIVDTVPRPRCCCIWVFCTVQFEPQRCKDPSPRMRVAIDDPNESRWSSPRRHALHHADPYSLASALCGPPQPQALLARYALHPPQPSGSLQWAAIYFVRGLVPDYLKVAGEESAFFPPAALVTRRPWVLGAPGDAGFALIVNSSELDRACDICSVSKTLIAGRLSSFLIIIIANNNISIYYHSKDQTRKVI